MPISEKDLLNYSLSDSAEGYGIPLYIQKPLERYYYYGVEPPGFLCSVLKGDVCGILIADPFYEHGPNFRNLVKFLWNYFPAECWGTPSKYQKHLDSFDDEKLARDS